MYVSIEFQPSNCSSFIRILEMYIYAADPVIILERCSEVKVIKGMQSQVLFKNIKCFFSLQGSSNTDVILEKYPYIINKLYFPLMRERKRNINYFLPQHEKAPVNTTSVQRIFSQGETNLCLKGRWFDAVGTRELLPPPMIVQAVPYTIGFWKESFSMFERFC